MVANAALRAVRNADRLSLMCSVRAGQRRDASMAAVHLPDADIVDDALCCSVLPGWCSLSLVSVDLLAVWMLTDVMLCCCCAVATFGASAAEDRSLPPRSVCRSCLTGPRGGCRAVARN